MYMPVNVWGGLDRSKDVIIVDRIGYFDLATLVEKWGADELCRMCLMHTEWHNYQLYLLSRKYHRMTRFTKLMDFEGIR